MGSKDNAGSAFFLKNECLQLCIESRDVITISYSGYNSEDAHAY